MKPLRSWQRFAKQFRQQGSLLNAWPGVPAIFVSGCQRSGGTMLSEALCEHPDVQDTSWSTDAELDSAQLLAGHIPFPPITRSQVCLQTTYLNERFPEYLPHRDKYKLIWLVRNPTSVVYSMVYNWKRFALNEVFLACGTGHLDERYARRLARFGVLGVPPLVRAACAYLGKAQQAEQLYTDLGSQCMKLVEYEYLVKNKPTVVSSLVKFCGLDPMPDVGAKINTKSLGKAARLNAKETALVADICGTSYEKLCRLVETQDDSVREA